jgi:hypothetical protein
LISPVIQSILVFFAVGINYSIDINQAGFGIEPEAFGQEYSSFDPELIAFDCRSVEVNPEFFGFGLEFMAFATNPFAFSIDFLYWSQAASIFGCFSICLIYRKSRTESTLDQT